MDIESQIEIRNATQSRRRAPSHTIPILATHENGVAFGEVTPEGAIELAIEATDLNGTLAEWLDDEWWAIVFERWWERVVTIRIAPTPGALLHPVVIHQLGMVRRVCSTWRIIGHAYPDDVVTEDDILILGGSPYHEVRFVDQARPGADRSERADVRLALPVLFSRIRSVQARKRLTTPILVRLPSPFCP